MERKLQLPIICGKTRCYSGPDKPCGFVRTGHFGTKWYCHIFHSEEELKEDEQSWLLRWPECIEAEVK